jgi:hypothetical protein
MSDSSVNVSLPWQSNVCESMGAPLSAQVLRLMAEFAAVSSLFAPFFEPFAALSPKAFLTAAVPLRALGALHFLVLSGQTPDLAVLYRAGGDARLALAIKTAIDSHPEVIARFRPRRRKQTRCVARFASWAGFSWWLRRPGCRSAALSLAQAPGLIRYRIVSPTISARLDTGAIRPRP